METKYSVCSKCGAKKFTNPDAWNSRIKKFGSEEAMKKNWVCRDCAYIAKYGEEQGKTARATKKKAKTEEDREDEIVEEANNEEFQN